MFLIYEFYVFYCVVDFAFLEYETFHSLYLKLSLAG